MDSDVPKCPRVVRGGEVEEGYGICVLQELILSRVYADLSSQFSIRGHLQPSLMSMPYLTGRGSSVLRNAIIVVRKSNATLEFHKIPINYGIWGVVFVVLLMLFCIIGEH